jgi:hypothetical protein
VNSRDEAEKREAVKVSANVVDSWAGGIEDSSDFTPAGSDGGEQVPVGHAGVEQ